MALHLVCVELDCGAAPGGATAVRRERERTVAEFTSALASLVLAQTRETLPITP